MNEISQASHCFAFEHDFVGDWRCIPLCVRRKLDLIGLKLKLNHWLAMSREQRQQLVDWDDQPAALAAMATLPQPDAQHGRRRSQTTTARP